MSLRFSADTVGKPLLAATALVSVGAVAAALFTQYQWDMQPCPWCIFQRVLFLLIALVAVLGLVTPGDVLRRVVAVLLGLLALGGVAAALWQHFVAAASASCSMTLADRFISGVGLDALWPEVFGVFASCAEAKAHIAGIPYEFWSLALFAAIAVAALRLLKGRPLF